jgi:hypothetical protein
MSEDTRVADGCKAQRSAAQLGSDRPRAVILITELALTLREALEGGGELHDPVAPQGKIAGFQRRRAGGHDHSFFDPPISKKKR